MFKKGVHLGTWGTWKQDIHVFKKGVHLGACRTWKQDMHVFKKVFTLGLGPHGNVAYRCLTRVFTGAPVAYKCLTRAFPLGPGAHGNGAYKSS